MDVERDDVRSALVRGSKLNLEEENAKAETVFC
jgi:hypothetical protein